MARLLDSRSGRSVSEPIIYETGVDVLSFSPDSQRLVAADSKVWRGTDVCTGLPLTSDRVGTGYPTLLEFSPDGQHVLIGGHATAEIWDFPAPAEPVPAWFVDFVEVVANVQMQGRVARPRGAFPLSISNPQ